MSSQVCRKDKAIGCMLGAVIGDALGATLEFSQRDIHPTVDTLVGGGVFDLPKGGWTDDTSMSLAIADSLISSKCFNPREVQDNFVAWKNDEKFSYDDRGCFDIGITTYEALYKYEEDNTTPFTGLTSKMSSGNGSIMRLSPIFTFYANDRVSGTGVAVEQSNLTHANALCLEYCKKCSEVVYDAFTGKLHTDILSQQHVHRDEVWSDGFVVNTYNASCWAISQTTNFKDALILAVNLAGDADTVGAVTGMFAGALYGLKGIPEDWVNDLVMSSDIVKTAEELFDCEKLLD